MNWKLNKHLKVLLCFSATTTAWATPKTDAEYSTVTGTRIAQEDVTSMLPVMIYSREDILRSGESNIADFIRNLSVNTFGSFRVQSGSSAQSTSAVNIRGLGSSRTLVLVDGRRLGNAPTRVSAADLNLIPMGAVERIEVLNDGASAIYGADALTGVVNVITRSEFQGVEVMLGGAEASIPYNGGEREEGSVLFGSQSEHSSLLAGVSWNDREIILNRDEPWTTPAFSIFGNNFTTISNGFDNFDLMPIPGGCDFPGTGYRQRFTFDICGYDFDLQAADEASIENKSFFAKAKHQINDHWKIYADSSFRRTESYGQFAPVPGNSVLGNPIPVDSPNNPTNPNSPIYDPRFSFAIPVNWWHRFDALGNRENTVKNQQLDFKLGTTGQFKAVTLDFGIRHLDNRSHDVGKNYVLRSAAESLINSGIYDLANPYAASENVLNSLRTTIFREARFDINEYFITSKFKVYELPAGMVSAVVGLEYRQEKYLDQYDPQSEANQILGSAGNSAGINRDIKSAFFETIVPIFDSLDLRLAVRNDDYSANGDAFNSNILLRYQPINNLSLRASYSENSRAPDMRLISQKPITSSLELRDPTTCINQGFDPGCAAFVEQTSFANTRLAAELSSQKVIGANFKIKDWFEIDLNLYDLNITNRIRSFTSQYILNAELNSEPIPSGLGCIRAPNGTLARCFVGFGNLGRVDTSGADLSVLFNYGLFGGQFNHHLQTSYIHDQSVDRGRDLISNPGQPQYRATLNNSYTRGNWQINYALNGIDKQQSSGFSSAVPSWITHDVQFNYHMPWRGMISIGAKNVGEKLPPVGLGQITRQAYNFSLYDGFGRIVYARYTQTF